MWANWSLQAYPKDIMFSLYLLRKATNPMFKLKFSSFTSISYLSQLRLTQAVIFIFPALFLPLFSQLFSFLSFHTHE